MANRASATTGGVGGSRRRLDSSHVPLSNVHGRSLIRTIAQSKRIIPYMDMPLQHINNQMLKRMARRVTRREIDSVGETTCGHPGLVLRTTLITGFPGETEAAFHELVQFVMPQQFERLGVFTYSYEATTPSAQLPTISPRK